MSKKRHKNKNESSNRENRVNPQQQRMNMGPFGINPTQLLSMLGNVDMNQINNMIQNMNRNGIDFNNFNLSSLQNLMGNPMQPNNSISRDSSEEETNPKSEYFEESIPIKETGETNKENDKKHRDNKNEHKTNDKFELEDDNIELLKSFRKIVRVDKVAFVDKIIEVYREGGFDD